VTAENVDLIRRGYENHGMAFSLSKWNVEAFLSMLADDVEWVEPNVPGLPWLGTHRGVRAVQDNVFGPGLDALEEMELVPDSYQDLGDFVLVTGHGHLVAKQTGRRWEGPFAHVWTIDAGKIVRWEGYADARNVRKIFEPS
jgi:ketosteroid isomerase-like protein